MIYRLIYQSISFFSGLSLNTKSFMLSIILSLFFHFSTSFLPLFAYHFIFSYTYLKAASAFFCTFFILSTNSIIFSFLLISASILNSLLYFAINRDTLIAECVLLLTANSADASYSSQFFCLWFTKNQRYCSNSWFICSVCPSVCE